MRIIEGRLDGECIDLHLIEMLSLQITEAVESKSLAPAILYLYHPAILLRLFQATTKETMATAATGRQRSHSFRIELREVISDIDAQRHRESDIDCLTNFIKIRTFVRLGDAESLGIVEGLL